MRSATPHDAGLVRWYVFIPGSGRWAVPPGVIDREGYAREVGATRLLVGNEVRWSADRAGKRHLAVVR